VDVLLDSGCVGLEQAVLGEEPGLLVIVTGRIQGPVSGLILLVEDTETRQTASGLVFTDPVPLCWGRCRRRCRPGQVGAARRRAGACHNSSC